MALADHAERRLTPIPAGLENTTHSPHLAGLHLRILPDLGHLPVGLITTGMIQDAAYARTADNCSRSTVKSTLAMLHHILRQAATDGLIAHEPAHVTGRQHEPHRAEDELLDPARSPKPATSSPASPSNNSAKPDESPAGGATATKATRTRRQRFRHDTTG